MEAQELLHQNCDFLQILEMGKIVLDECTGLKTKMNLGLVHLCPVLVDLRMSRVVKYDINV